MSKKTNYDSYSEEYLRGWSGEHLFYEINLLHASVERLSQTRPQTLDMDLAIVSMCIHWRNLIEFLYDGRSRWDDDICAFHFLVSAEHWEKAHGVKPKRVSDKQKRIHKECAHLTTKRYAEPEQKGWDRVELVGHMITPLTEFVEHADSAKLSPKVNQVSERLIKWYEGITG